MILYLFYRDPLFLAFLLWRKIKLTRSAFFAYRQLPSILRQHVCAKEFAKKIAVPLAPSSSAAHKTRLGWKKDPISPPSLLF